VTSPDASAAELLRNRDFLRLWTGQIASDTATNSSLLVVPLLVLSTTGSATRAGAVTTVAAVTSAVGRLPGGALADRFGRRGLMVGSGLGRMALHLVLGVCLLSGPTPLWLIAGITVLAALFEVVFAPAETAATARVVPPTQLRAAFAGNEARRSGASLAGPALGGVLYGLGAAVPFLVQALTYGASALVVSRIRTTLQKPRPQEHRTDLVRQIREGVVHVLGDRFLRTVLLVAAPVNFALSGAVFCLTVSLRQSGMGADRIGLAQACIGIGGVAGALAAPRLIRRVDLRRLAVLVCLALALSTLAAATLTGSAAMALPLAAGFFLAPAVNAALFARIGSSTPDELLSRVLSVMLLAATVSAALAPGLCGLLVDVVGAVPPLLACAVLDAAALVVAHSSGGLSDTDPAAEEPTAT